jgi:hypothetical protein
MLVDQNNRIPPSFPDLHALKAAALPLRDGAVLHAYCANPECGWRDVTRPAHVLLTTRRKKLPCGACFKPLTHYYLA